MFVSFLLRFRSVLSAALFCVIPCVITSCASHEDDVLIVKHFHLQKVAVTMGRGGAMARGEQLYRLRGAVSLKEREARMGHYYTVSWKNDSLGRGDLKVVMDYQQTATGAKVLHMVQDLPDDQSDGKCEFNIIGDAYLKRGSVLTWRIRLYRGKKIIAEKHSYLWK